VKPHRRANAALLFIDVFYKATPDLYFHRAGVLALASSAANYGSLFGCFAFFNRSTAQFNSSRACLSSGFSWSFFAAASTSAASFFTSSGEPAG
jgi:hypothetical protein